MQSWALEGEREEGGEREVFDFYSFVTDFLAIENLFLSFFFFFKTEDRSQAKSDPRYKTIVDRLVDLVLHGSAQMY